MTAVDNAADQPVASCGESRKSGSDFTEVCSEDGSPHYKPQ